MKKLLPLVLLLGCSTPEPQSCYNEDSPVEKYRERISKTMPQAKMVTLTSEQREAFLKVFNGSHPPTAVNYSTVMYIDLPGPMLVLVFVHHGCVWVTQPVPRQAMQEIIGQSS